MANEGGRILFIRGRAYKRVKVSLEITAANKKQKTEVIKIDGVGVLPKWTQNLMLDFDPQAVVLWELCGRRRWWLSPHFKVLGSVEKKLGELFGGTSTGADIHLYNGSSEVAVLKISCKLDKGSKLLDSNDTLDTVLEAVKQMIDVLANVGDILQANPYCLTSLFPRCTLRLPIAWGFLSIGFKMKVLKKQHDTNQAIRDLYTDMISAYDAFSKDDILEQCVRLQGIYNSLFKQTIECAIFIEGYTKESGIKHLFEMDISGQAEKFRQAFVDLKSHLSMGYAKEAVIVTLGVQKSVDVLVMRERLRDLHPPQELGPKS
ncbi:uncharacterized protein EV420DRAFT_1733535 [Desarmillaria tabescens]|uniref:Uncharacterized protein n=1 Tax=Armillaria tabescens TaxID=1929756 RepID=A0AA39JBS8_ARMTA|nr:uncharacterized protein EV420DRAFT_1733535 [Desarmillaria tabescens]KAK0439718.1 hypothetical protein EV420DRAFT_1733535 [Desarmillaria tabescens]